jgi:hypothetical protein
MRPLLESEQHAEDGNRDRPADDGESPTHLTARSTLRQRRVTLEPSAHRTKTVDLAAATDLAGAARGVASRRVEEC